jgi:D-3-phosphoglycerate dehydrogenase
MSKPVVLLFEPIHSQAVELLAQHAEVRMADNLEPEYLLKNVPEVQGIIIRANGKVDRGLMEAAPNLKVVARHGTGVEAIDLHAAQELGIKVVNTPEANVESVAEQCLGMMIILAKRILQADRDLHNGDWDSRYRLTGIELLGKTLGVVGIGRIGYRVAELCHQGLHMPVLYYDIVSNPEAEQGFGAKRVGLNQLLETADFVSIHLPLVPATREIINAQALTRMKSSAFLINSSRGAVVDQAALILALQHGTIAGAGLDVYASEPLPANNPLLQLDNVVVTPHMAAHTEEALLRMAMVVEDVIAVLEGDEPKNPVLAG